MAVLEDLKRGQFLASIARDVNAVATERMHLRDEPPAADPGSERWAIKDAPAPAGAPEAFARPMSALALMMAT